MIPICRQAYAGQQANIKTGTPVNKMETSIQQDHMIHNYNQSDDVIHKVHMNIETVQER